MVLVCKDERGLRVHGAARVCVVYKVLQRTLVMSTQSRNHLAQVMAKLACGEAECGIKIISISVDSRSVLDWIGGGSVNYKAEECLIIERIYESIRRLGKWNITVFLSWVRAHNGTPLNELADDCAKLGMMNQRISLRWSRRFTTRYGRAEWALISTKSVRRQCMKAAMARTIAAWKTEKAKKRRLIATGKRLRKNVCSRFLLDWDISIHSAYTPERLAMSRRE